MGAPRCGQMNCYIISSRVTLLGRDYKGRLPLVYHQGLRVSTPLGRLRALGASVAAAVGRWLVSIDRSRMCDR
jgi:hypothetical protein